MSARSFDLSKPKKYGNVTIDKVNKPGVLNLTYVRLRGNLIIEIDYFTKTFRLDHCGWITATTCVAMNTALKQLRFDVIVFRKRGEMFVSFANGEEVSALNPEAWYGF